MMYWIDGEIVAIQDSPKEPVYSFTTGNIENGIFNYTYTGQRARINQINVTWNNPLEMYKKTVLTVEDTQNIESVGKVIPNDIVAFGCTSEGQARRLADWHLSTVKNEGEVVSFTTGLNAAFLRPGDIVNVQDKHRHGFEVSGRVSASSSTTSINLDRTVTAPGGGNLNGCNLYLIYTEPGIYLKQESATINSVAYSRGEILVEDASGNSLISQSQAANLVDDSGSAVLTQFSENSRVEVKAITTNGSSGSTITVSGGFSSAPQQDTVWAISRKDDVNTDDIKEYRVLSISQDEANTFEVAASLYQKDKFDEIDADLPVVTNNYIPTPKMSDPVPAPTGLGIEQLPSSTTSNEGTGTTVSVVASWTPPVEGFTDSNGTTTNISYRFLSGFEIQHTFPTGNESSSWTTVKNINGNANTFTFSNVDAGRYTIRVRAVNTLGNYSAWNEVTREIFSLPPGTSRIARVSRGGFLTFSPEINASTGLISIDGTAYRYIHPSGEEYIFNPASTAQLQKSFSNLPAGQSAFWVFDASNTSTPWLDMQLHTDSVATDASGNASNFNYLKTIGASNNGLTAASGTVTVAAGSTEVTGSSTAFTTDYYVGGFIKVSSNSAAGTQVANSEYREVVEIESNTKLFVRNPFTRAFSGQSPMKQTTGIRFQEDAILAEVTRASSGTTPYTAEFYVQGKGAGGSDTTKTVHVFRSGTLPVEVPDPTTAEVGRGFVENDFVIIHYTDKSVALVYDGTGWGEEAEYFDGRLIRENTLPIDSIEEEATLDKIDRLKNVYDAVSQTAVTGRGQITFRNSADNANATSWTQVGKIKISSIDSENIDKSAKLSKISQRTHIHIVEDVSDAAQDSGTVPSRAVYKAAAGTSVGTTTSSSVITSVGHKSVRVNLSNVNNTVQVGDTFSATGISIFFNHLRPKVTRVQMSSTPYYVILSTSVPKFINTRIATFTREQHTITVGSPLAASQAPNYNANYIVKLQVQSPSEVTTGETLLAETVTGEALAPQTVTGAKIAGATIQAANIVDGTITGTKISSSTILDSNIVNGTITGTSIDNATITGSNMVNGTITGTKIDSATITASNIVDGTITGTKIDSATITGSNMVNGTITGTKIDAATITGSNIANTTLTGSNMVNSTITGTQIANSTITGGKIAAATIADANIVSGTITGTRIASATLTNSLLVNNTIQGGKIALATIQGGNIATNTITANNITVTTLSSLSANIGAISSGSLQGGTIPDANGAPSGSETGSFFDLTLGRFVIGNASNYVLWNGTSLVIGGSVIASGNIQSNAVTQAKIASAAVGATEIANLAVQRAKIANDAIDATKVAANAITATEIAANTITASQLTTGEFVTNTANIGDGIITNAKIGSLDATKITSGTIAAGRIDASTITIGNLNGASSFKGALGNLNNPSSPITPTDDTLAATKITAAQVNGNVTNISGGAIQTGTVSAARIDVGSITIGSLSGTAAEKRSAIGAGTVNPGDVNGNVTSISGGVITTGTINGNSVNVTNINASNISTGTLNADRINANSIDLSKLNDVVVGAGSNGNIGFGVGALASGSTGTYFTENVAIGYYAGNELADPNNFTASNKTVFIGFQAGRYNHTGAHNIGIGNKACGGDNTSSSNPPTGYMNVAIGSECLEGLRDGQLNVALGTACMSRASQCDGTVAIGTQTFISANANSDYNVCIGHYAATDLGDSNFGTDYGGASNNVMIGHYVGYLPYGNTGYHLFGGNENVLIGRNARTNAYANRSASNQIAIGAHALARGANTATIGNSSVSSIGGYATWSNLSDERDKISITDLSLGLNLVNTITPKKFKLNPRDLYYSADPSASEEDEQPNLIFDQENFDKGTQARADFSYGFLAQEVKEKVDALDSDPTSVIDESDSEKLYFRSSELIAVLWKAVQELSDKNDALEARIATLEGG